MTRRSCDDQARELAVPQQPATFPGRDGGVGDGPAAGCGSGMCGARPKVKLVIAADARPWTGTVYPTKQGNGVRRSFSTLEELVIAVSELTAWRTGD